MLAVVGVSGGGADSTRRRDTVGATCLCATALQFNHDRKGCRVNCDCALKPVPLKRESRTELVKCKLRNEYLDKSVVLRKFCVGIRFDRTVTNQCRW